MLSFICNVFEWIRKLFWKKELEITIIGLQNAGKTSFVNAISNGQFYQNMLPTVGFNMRSITKGRVSIKMWDLGGQKRFRSMWERYCRGVDAMVYVVDSADVDHIQESADEMHELLKNNQLRFVPLLVLGNKKDLPDSLDEKDMIKRMNLNDIQDRKVYYYTISCKKHQNLDTVLQCLITHAKF